MLLESPPAAEYEAVSTGAGLLDRSDRGKLELTGAGSAEFLDGQLTNAISDLRTGSGCYAAFLTHKGKMLGDVRVLALNAGGLWLDTERSALQGLFDLIRRFKIGYEVELHKRTLERGILSLLGPRSRAVTGATGLGTLEHDHADGRLADYDVLLVATDVGVDVICDAADIDGIREALITAGAVPVSAPVADASRILAGRPRYGVDIDDSTIPEEAGLNERAVSFTKGCYVGQETVARLHWRGKPNRHLRGLVLEGGAVTGDELRLGDRIVGTLGSVAPAADGRLVGLALVRREAAPGDRVAVGDGPTGAVLVALPFPST